MRYTQPQGQARIDWSNPITKGLVSVHCVGTPFDLVQGKNFSLSGAPTVTRGVSRSGAWLSFSGTDVGIYSAPPDVGATNSTSLYIGEATGFNNHTHCTTVLGTLSTYCRIVSTATGVAAYAIGSWGGLQSPGFTIETGKEIVAVLVSKTWVNNYFYMFGNYISATGLVGGAPGYGSFCGFGAAQYDYVRKGKLFCAWSRALSDAEIKTISNNPWQIFVETKKDPTEIFVGVFASVSLPTLVQPESDTTVGAWTSSTGGTLVSCIRETVPEDTDFISVSSASTCEMVLAESAFPGAGTQILKYRASSTSASSLTVTLKQGATTIMTRTHVLTGTITEYTDTLTSGEIATIVAGPISVTLECS